MTMYVYATSGEPRGFLYETTLYNLDGIPLGRLLGVRVHRFDGSYAGEWFHQMVVIRGGAKPRTVPPKSPPPARPPVARSAPRRDVAEYHVYPDAFDLLLGSAAAEEAFRHAAE
jgi:hypothetical protein